MTRRGLLLCGPPAAGKDTVTTALAQVDSRFALVRKWKVGTGRTAGYRMATATELSALEAAGRVVVRTERYGNTYGLDRADLEALWTAGRIPVVHAGSVADLQAVIVVEPKAWATVLLSTDRETCQVRSKARRDGDTEARLRAWDEAMFDLEQGRQRGLFDQEIRTDQVVLPQTVRAVTELFRQDLPEDEAS